MFHACSRKDLLQAVNEGARVGSTTYEGTVPAKEPLLVLLDKTNEKELMDVLAESFLEDPLMKWCAGLDCEDLKTTSTEAAVLQLDLNRILLGWTNRSILVGKKGVAIGVMDPRSTSKKILGAIALMPSKFNNESIVNTIKNLCFVGAPPFYTSKKDKYGPFGDKRLDSMKVLSKRSRDELVKRELNVSDFLIIQTLGVLSTHHGKGLGGKLLRAGLSVADTLKIPTFLYTESKKNESMYHHFGFVTVEVIELTADGTPTKQPIYLMLRHPPKFDAH